MTRTEIKRGDRWEPAAFEDIKAGDTFRLHEDNVKIIDDLVARDGNGHALFHAVKDDSTSDDGNAQVSCSGFGVLTIFEKP